MQLWQSVSQRNRRDLSPVGSDGWYVFGQMHSHICPTTIPSRPNVSSATSSPSVARKDSFKTHFSGQMGRRSVKVWTEHEMHQPKKRHRFELTRIGGEIGKGLINRASLKKRRAPHRSHSKNADQPKKPMRAERKREDCKIVPSRCMLFFSHAAETQDSFSLGLVGCQVFLTR
ncbi:unnamed protein product [Protopolystoma xenopodis]|uniref:Uncharacterized protein n=1 Tax=Protopolystoma xenopodis TaxID=117903 RepID=A0A3S5CGP3_9PLAT|nr:unnamed protein product [Protopolystoma xenopodis]